MFVVLANAGNTLKRKGYLFGTLEVLLDLCPVVCVFKAAIEAYTGDLIPAKAEPAAASLQAMTELA